MRELRNVMERAVVLSRQRLILPSDLPTRLRKAPAPFPLEAPDRPAPLLPLAEVERQHVLRVLRQVQGNKASAARLLGIGRETLCRKLEGWGVPTGQAP